MFRSLRWRIQAWHTLILLLVIVGLEGMLYTEARKARFDEIDAELLAAARVLEGVLRTTQPPLRSPRDLAVGPPVDDRPNSPANRPPHPPRRGPPSPGAPPEEPGFFDGPPPGPPRRPLHDQGPPGHRLMPMRPPPAEPKAFSLPNSLVDHYVEAGEPPYFVIRSPEGEVIRANPPEVADQVPPDPEVGRRFESHSRNRGMLREVTLLGPGRTTIVVGRPIHHELAGLRRMAWLLGLTGLGVFSAGLVGGWWLSSRAVRPIVAMSRDGLGDQRQQPVAAG